LKKRIFLTSTGAVAVLDNSTVYPRRTKETSEKAIAYSDFTVLLEDDEIGNYNSVLNY